MPTLHPLPLIVGWLSLLLILLATTVQGQDRETLTRICDEYAAANKSIRVGVLDKGDSSFPQSAWNGVFGHIETSFLSRFGCKTQVTLYPFGPLYGNVSAGNIDFIFANPVQGTQFEVQNGAKTFVSLTMQYTSPTNGRLPFPGVSASLDRFGAVMMYAHANMTKGFGNNTVPGWVQDRRALIDSYAPQTYEDIIAMLPHFPAKNLTICAVSATSLGGYQMINYEFMNRGVVMSAKFNIIIGGKHTVCIDKVLSGAADFTNIRTGQIEVYINDTRIDPGTFNVINNAPTKYFPLYVSTPLYPEWPVQAMPWIDQSLVQAFSVPLTALSILTNTPEAAAVSGASFSYPFSYDSVRTLMFDLDVIGDGECASGWARSLPTDPLPLNPKVPHPCFACSSGTYVKVANGTSTCQLCPLNTYNVGSGVNCTACPSGMVTHSSGATSSDQCVEPTKSIVHISTASSTAMIVVCVICLVVFVGCGVGVLIFRTNPVMKAASPPFLLLVLLGLAVLCASIIPRSLDNVNTSDASRYDLPSAVTCNADLWLSNLGYTLVTSSLLVKTWRLYSIFTSRQLAGRTPLSDFKILCVVIVLMLAQCALLLGLTQSEPLEMGIHSYDNKSDYITCSTRTISSYSFESLYLPVIMVPRFALLIATTVAAFLVRNLPAAFNESSQLLYTMYNLSFFSVLLPAIDAALGRGKDSALIAYSVSMFIICLLTAVILFTPKFVLIARGKTTDTSQLTHTSSSHHTGKSAAGASPRNVLGGKSSTLQAVSPGQSIPLPKTTNGGKTSTAGSYKTSLGRHSTADAAITRSGSNPNSIGASAPISALAVDGPPPSNLDRVSSIELGQIELAPSPSPEPQLQPGAEVGLSSPSALGVVSASPKINLAILTPSPSLEASGAVNTVPAELRQEEGTGPPATTSPSASVSSSSSILPSSPTSIVRKGVTIHFSSKLK